LAEVATGALINALTDALAGWSTCGTAAELGPRMHVFASAFAAGAAGLPRGWY
jgi:hypothetical protein